ncbi:hypothetical protein CJ030_MR5G022575 [Morella rubra]|uniref:Uncharacterized protein n=1 Tax=Morella rubra TaxID=262757 RepID=A0A6A1VLC4_9ROSI|nr:hypothetical protein CJ030_MR5G022575 [Morella rubra]
MSPIPSPTPSAPSPRANEAMSQGIDITSKRGRGRTRGDHFDLDYTCQEDVRTVVETMMTARQTHRNRKHAYFKKFQKRSEQNKKNRSKLTVNHAAGSRSFQRTRACMKNQESGEINPAELYKRIIQTKMVWTSEGAREIYERMDAFQRQCDLEGKTYTKLKTAVKPPPSSTLTTQSSDLQHQLAKARDEIEAMRAAREKDLQEFVKKQAEMEATLRDHREEQRVEQERIRLEQEERMKRSKSACEWSTRSACNRNKSACERSKSAYGQKYRRNWRRKCPL